MLVYKALYRKMMDDLKDAGMWLDWAEQIMCDYPEYAEFLIESAEERLDKTFGCSPRRDSVSFYHNQQRRSH